VTTVVQYTTVLRRTAYTARSVADTVERTAETALLTASCIFGGNVMSYSGQSGILACCGIPSRAGVRDVVQLSPQTC